MKNIREFSEEIKRRFSKKEVVNRIVTKSAEKMRENCDYARQTGEYNDVSGTMRSAIMFQVKVDGAVRAEGGYENIQGTEPQKVDPMALAQMALDETPTSGEGLEIVFVNVAEYAKYVEDKGRNVMHLAVEKMKDDMGDLF